MFNMDVQDIQDLLIVTFLSVQFSQTGFLLNRPRFCAQILCCCVHSYPKTLPILSILCIHVDYTILVVNVPSLSMVASTVSPACSHLGESIPAATPGGLPLVITSPGYRPMWDHQETSSAVL